MLTQARNARTGRGATHPQVRRRRLGVRATPVQLKCSTRSFRFELNITTLCRVPILVSVIAGAVLMLFVVPRFRTRLRTQRTFRRDPIFRTLRNGRVRFTLDDLMHSQQSYRDSQQAGGRHRQAGMQPTRAVKLRRLGTPARAVVLRDADR